MFVKNWLRGTGFFILVVIASVLAVKFIDFSKVSNGSSQDQVANKVISSGDLRIGYITYFPFTYMGKDGKLTGVSYDIVEAAAKKLNLKTDWVEEVGWGTSLEGLTAKRYDILGTQIWPNSSRAREAVFSSATLDSPLYPYVRVGDNRFVGDLSKINSSNVRIVTTDGDAAISIAQQDYPNAKLITLPQMTSSVDTLENIVDGKADVALLEPSVADTFIKSNPSKIQRSGDKPVRNYGDVFAFARGEESMVSMWNVALGELTNDGAIENILEKYNVSQYYPIKNN